MLPSSRQSGGDNGSGSGKRSRRSTSDALSAKRWSLAAFTTIKRPSNADANAFPGSLPSFGDQVVANELHLLHKYTMKIRTAAKNVSHVDSAWDDYIKHKEKCLEYCKSLMAAPSQKRDSTVVSPTTILPPKSDLHSDGSNLVTVDSGSSTQSAGSRIDSPLRPSFPGEQYHKAVCQWEITVDLLAGTLRSSLQETYNEYGKDATPEGFERICTDKAYRLNTIYHMRNASISKMMSADLDFFPKYDVRFRNYDEIKKDLAKVRSLLGTSGIPQSRTIIERRISPTGDAMLEFANVENEKYPVFRFRVASDCLRELSSPIFGHMFNAHFRVELDDELRRSLPPPPTRYVCSDGNEVMLYRMPQTELNTERSLEILLHAAHNHNERVPRDVQFRLFVAIAEACLRYRCTSPLELAVEHLWLPYWQSKATDDMLGEVLLISYVFGLSENFARLSRRAILNIAGPSYVQCKSWPRQVEGKIAAVRNAKIEQVYEQCRATLCEYLHPTQCRDSTSNSNDSHANQLSGLRCPKGDRTCDAQNLGWYMKSLTELGMLLAVLPSPALSGTPAPQTRSLQGIADSLCQITSPPQCHGGICDFAPAFRAAIKDIYDSVPELTLLEVSGKSGWALSKNRSPRQSAHGQSAVPGGGREQLFEIARQRYSASNHRYPIAPHGHGGDDNDDICFFKILSLLEDPRDLRSAALINKRFYRSYLRNETRLREGLQGAGMGKAPAALYQQEIAEIDGTPYKARASHDSGVTLDSDGIIPPREKFRHGQLLLVEDKRLVESDVNKYAGGVRERLLGLRIKENEGARQRSHQ